MPGRPLTRPFQVRRLNEADTLAVSQAGDFVFLAEGEMDLLRHSPNSLPSATLAELQAKFFLRSAASSGMDRFLASRLLTKLETILSGPSLHILVTTLRCGHSCRYCQVSRSQEDEGFTMSEADLDAAIGTIFESPAPALTIEFQGGDPLLRFDLVRRAIEKIESRNRTERRDLRFVVASTLHQLNEDMCSFFKAHEVYLSTSVDGPAALHNRNRPLPTRDSYERTVQGINTARALIGAGAVAALTTATRDSLDRPEEIVDEYVRLGFSEIFIRPLSHYGFARRNQAVLGYSLSDFQTFYERAFNRVLHWNRHGVDLREVSASIVLNKILSPFDAGYVDLQSPTGAGLAVLVYNYDGYVYPSDEARMLAESGDASLRLGRIGEPMNVLLEGDVQRALINSSLSDFAVDCRECAYKSYCDPDPIAAYNQWGAFSVPAGLTEHCHRQMGLFDFLFRQLLLKDSWFEELAHRWAKPLVAQTTLIRA